MEEKKRFQNEDNSAKFWLFEEPKVFRTEKNVFRYYPKARKLVCHLPDYQRRDGTVHTGKGVGVNLGALAKSPEATFALLQIITDIGAEILGVDPADVLSQAEAATAPETI